MTTLSVERVRSGTTMPIRDVSLFVKVVGRGDPLLLMHGGPGADHTTMLPFRRLADRFTLVFYDHRCNGRSTGAPSSMTWENLTAVRSRAWCAGSMLGAPDPREDADRRQLHLNLDAVHSNAALLLCS